MSLTKIDLRSLSSKFFDYSICYIKAKKNNRIVEKICKKLEFMFLILATKNRKIVRSTKKGLYNFQKYILLWPIF